MSGISIPQALFYALVSILAILAVAAVCVWLVDFFGEIRYLSTNDVRKRRRRKLPRVVRSVLAFFMIFGTAYAVAWIYALDGDFTVWSSDVRAAVCGLGGGLGLIVACVLYLEAGRPKF